MTTRAPLPPNDLYAVLGVGCDAQPDALRAAFRRRSLETHPDVCPDDPMAPARFRTVREAYDVLSDPERRRLYDELGRDALAKGADPAALRRARCTVKLTPRKNDQGAIDLIGLLAVAPREAHEGRARMVTISRGVACEGCGGSGSTSNNCPACGGAGCGRDASRAECDACEGRRVVPMPEPCTVPCSLCWGRGHDGCEGCGGQGVIVTSWVTCARCAGAGSRALASRGACPTCGGEGRFWLQCSRCEGTRLMAKVEVLRVSIPARVTHGQHLRVAGKGLWSPSSPPGDLLLRVDIRA